MVGNRRDSGPGCEACLLPGPPLNPQPDVPRALADELAHHSSDEHIVYDLRFEPRRVAQVGSGRPARVRSRWNATVGRGRLAPDAIWWLYDLAKLDAADSITVELLVYRSAKEALSAEERLREELRHDGWQVSSDR